MRVSHQIEQKARNSDGFSVPGRENGYCLDTRQTPIFNDIYLIFFYSKPFEVLGSGLIISSTTTCHGLSTTRRPMRPAGGLCSVLDFSGRHCDGISCQAGYFQLDTGFRLLAE